jgi:hypothetical protein
MRPFTRDRTCWSQERCQTESTEDLTAEITEFAENSQPVPVNVD